MKDPLKEYDVIIIGARIAGAITATLLAEAGKRVLLLDRSTFPSDTLSTHFFRAPSLRAFQQIGILDEVLETAPQLTVNYNVIDGIAFPEPVDRPDDYPFYMCVRRITLDDILIRKTRETDNVDLREGAIAKALLHEDDRIVGVTWKEGTGTHSATAKTVIGADGVRSFVAKELGVKTEQEQPVSRAMYYAYYRGMKHQEGPAAEFHYRDNYLAYVMPTDDDLTLMAISVPIADFPAFRHSPQKKLMQELHAMSEISQRLGEIKQEGPVHGSGVIPCYMRIPYGPGWALVGDAGMALDPWSGQGIDQASRHAVLLSEHLGEFLKGQADWETSMKAYHQNRNAFSKKAYQRTAKFSADLRPMAQAALKARGLV